MNFTDALLTVNLVIKSEGVPLIIGESGIGKTALVRELCSREGYVGITIDGNLLKEGEIGGLPAVGDYTLEIDGRKITRKETLYAVHTKLREIDQISSRKKGQRILLFIDELNRCEHSVQQELMNLVQNREINGYTLPENVKVIAAMNPSNKYSSFEDTDYRVVDLDPAQEDRFVWIEMEADAKTWIKWGMEDGNIHQDVLEFIACFPEYLHTPNSRETVKATPRSWERISKSYRIYLRDKDNIPSRIFFNAVKGNAGPSIAQDFYNYIQDKKYPLIKPEEIFSMTRENRDMAERVMGENHSRLYMAAKSALACLNGMEERNSEIEAFSRFLQLYPDDLKMAIMQEIKSTYGETLYKEFLEDEEFVRGYFEMYEALRE